jgi:hypothetical protein
MASEDQSELVNIARGYSGMEIQILLIHILQNIVTFQ